MFVMFVGAASRRGITNVVTAVATSNKAALNSASGSTPSTCTWKRCSPTTCGDLGLEARASPIFRESHLLAT